MDTSKLIARAKAILFTPKTEWPVIAGEPATVKGLYLGYIMILAAIPPIFSFIKGSLIGYSALGIHVRTGIGAGIVSAIVAWILALVGVYIVALIVKALAKTFDGQPDEVQAVKTLAYAYTASWVAGVGVIIPWIGWLILIAGGIYSLYLLYLGLPQTMKCPPEKALVYTVVTVICAIVVYIVIGLIVGSIAGIGMSHGGGITASNGSGTVTIDKNSMLGTFASMGRQMQAASKRMATVEGSDNGATGSGGTSGASGKSQSVSPDQLKHFVPDELGGLPRTSISAQRNGTFQVASVSADYGKSSGDHHLHLDITDLGGMSSLMGLAHMAGDSETHTDHGFDKTYQKDGNMVEEHWDGSSHHGKFSTTVADRFSVKVSGTAADMDAIKDAADSLDLSGLAALAGKK